MIYLIFELGGDRYALAAQQVVEVLPLMDSKTLPGAPTGVTGLINYRGKPVPLVDLTLLLLGQPCARRMSTRIILLSSVTASGEPHLIGLLAERVTETIRRQDSDFKHVSTGSRSSTISGPVLTEGSTLVQRVDVHDIVPRLIQEELFAEIKQIPT
jgi:chemotaxis-related protein WspB